MQELAYAHVHRDRRPRPGEGLRPGLRGRLREGRRPDLVLRQRRRPVRRGDLQDAGLRRSCGTRSPGSGTASQDPKMRRFRYGVQVNSLGLTEAQPENNVQRIVLEMLGVTLSKNARARAVQLPGLERGARPAAAVGPAVVAAAPAGAGLRVRPARVRRHLRRLATSIEAKVAELVEGAKAEIDRVQAMGGAIAAVESGYMKQDARLRARRPPRPGSSRARRSSSASTGSRPPSPRR